MTIDPSAKRQSDLNTSMLTAFSCRNAARRLQLCNPLQPNPLFEPTGPWQQVVADRHTVQITVLDRKWWFELFSWTFLINRPTVIHWPAPFNLPPSSHVARYQLSVPDLVHCLFPASTSAAPDFIR